MQLTQEDSGRHVPMRVGERVTVTLPEKPTTGYQWTSVVDAHALQELENRFDGAAAPRGGGGNRVLTFQAIRPGQATVHCAYRRAWEQEEAEQFEVYLEVQD